MVSIHEERPGRSPTLAEPATMGTLKFKVSLQHLGTAPMVSSCRLRWCVALFLQGRRVPTRPSRRGCAEKARKVSRERRRCFWPCVFGPGFVANQPCRGIVTATEGSPIKSACAGQRAIVRYHRDRETEKSPHPFRKGWKSVAPSNIIRALSECRCDCSVDES